MNYGTERPAGFGVSTTLASMDFETYSEAGYRWIENHQQWQSIQPNKPGLQSVGAWVYSQHPSTEVLTFSFNLKRGAGYELWRPDEPNPLELFERIRAGDLFEAVNSFFEFSIWTNVCRRRYGWPELPLTQLRDVAAKAGSWNLPRALDKVTRVLRTPTPKDSEGQKIMRRVSRPRNPTKNDSRKRHYRSTSPADFERLDSYCIDDVRSEDEVSERCPDLSPTETRIFLVDQAINARGVHCDREAVEAAITIIEQAAARYNEELGHITSGEVRRATELDKIKKWVSDRGFYVDSITKDNIDELVATAPTPEIRRIMEIRQIMSSQSVKKTYAMRWRMGDDDRIRGLYTYCGAARTWRWSGAGVQPQNLPKAGPPVVECLPCGAIRWAGLWFCPSCYRYEHRKTSWGYEAAEACLPAILSRSLDTVESLWGDALTAIAGCLRSFFTAGPGLELICSDYSAIEAVILAELAGEAWRQEVFRTHGKIYETSASRIFHVPIEEFAKYKTETKMNHPLRAKGKIAELASGYQGWVGAWRKFVAEGSDDEIADQVKAWRAASPEIVKLWAGLEDAAIKAVQYPGSCFGYRGVRYQMAGGGLYGQLPSGRAIPYHAPKLREESRYGKLKITLSYAGIGDNGNWARIDTYGGKLAEQATQATARDAFAASLPRLEDAGYPIVLHTHDEPTAEVKLGAGSVEEFERIMQRLDPWCAEWPIKAAGGWRGHRYRKD
jgi:DNA polymerase